MRDLYKKASTGIEFTLILLPFAVKFQYQVQGVFGFKNICRSRKELLFLFIKYLTYYARADWSVELQNLCSIVPANHGSRYNGNSTRKLENSER